MSTFHFVKNPTFSLKRHEFAKQKFNIVAQNVLKTGHLKILTISNGFFSEISPNVEKEVVTYEEIPESNSDVCVYHDATTDRKWMTNCPLESAYQVIKISNKRAVNRHGRNTIFCFAKCILGES